MIKMIRETFTGTGIGQSIGLAGYFSLSLQGAWVGTIQLQRSIDGGESWGTVESYTANTEDIGHDPPGGLYRLRCSAYTSGNIEARLGQ